MTFHEVNPPPGRGAGGGPLVAGTMPPPRNLAFGPSSLATASEVETREQYDKLVAASAHAGRAAPL